MNPPQFCSRLEEALCPAMYRGRVHSDAATFDLLLKRWSWGGGRYAFGVLPWEKVGDKADLLGTARREVMKHMFTIPHLWQVGLYLVVPGPAGEWKPLAEKIAADRTALHRVIVQGVHFIDLETGAKTVHRSKWGTISFGGTVSVQEVVDSVRG